MENKPKTAQAAEKEEQVKEIDPKRKAELQQCMNALKMNDYVRECLVFGRIHVGDKVPIAQYCRELDLDGIPDVPLRAWKAALTDENAVVRTSDIEQLRSEMYNEAMDVVLCSVLDYAKHADEDAFARCGNELSAYIRECYPLFCEIVATDAQCDPTALQMPYTEEEQCKGLQAAEKLLVAIKARQLRTGECVDAYVKDCIFLPPFVQRLTEMRDGKHILVIDDPESVLYKLAVFNSIPFVSVVTRLLFERKCRKWFADSLN